MVLCPSGIGLNEGRTNNVRAYKPFAPRVAWHIAVRRGLGLNWFVVVTFQPQRDARKKSA